MNCNVLHTIPIQILEHKNKLYTDYLSDLHKGISGCLQGFAPDAAFWTNFAAGPARHKNRLNLHLWMDVIDDVVNISERAGASADVLASLNKARDEEILFVITGQQAGLAGGPLLTIYKAAASVALADWLQARLSMPVVPLFWIAADDADFDETKSLSLLASDMSPLSTSIPSDAHDPGMPIGDISLEAISGTWENISSFFEGLAGGGCVGEWISRALSAARDNGEFFASIMSLMCGGRLAFVDGRSGPVRRFSKPLFTEFLENEDEIKQLVIRRGERLRSAGYHAQLSPGRDSGIFMLQDGRRRTVPPERVSLLRDTIDASIEQCSPGVILRNLVQDYVFQPAAVVLGPAELAYRAQITDVYVKFAVRRPVVIPRMSATYLPPPLRELLTGKHTVDYESLLRNPAQFAAGLYDRFVPGTMREAFGRFRTSVTRGVDEVQRAVEGGIPDKILKRLAGRLNDIERRTGQLSDIESEAGKYLARRKHPSLANLESAIRPQNKKQERVLSSLTPFLFAGEEAGEAIRLASNHYIAELMDGSPCHIVYSA